MASHVERDIPAEGQGSSMFCGECFTPLDQVVETFCPACGVTLPVQFSESKPG